MSYATSTLRVKLNEANAVEEIDNIMKAVIWNDMISLAFYKTSLN